jgi:hypothetical protein
MLPRCSVTRARPRPGCADFAGNDTETRTLGTVTTLPSLQLSAASDRYGIALVKLQEPLSRLAESDDVDECRLIAIAAANRAGRKGSALGALPLLRVARGRPCHDDVDHRTPPTRRIGVGGK